MIYALSYYYSDDTLTKGIPVALSQLNANDKSEVDSSHQISTTTEGLYMTSDIENKKPPPYKPIESAPQNVRYIVMYVATMCIITMLSKNTIRRRCKKSEAKSEAPVSSYSYMRLKSLIPGGGQGPSCLASNNARSITWPHVYYT